MFFFWLIEDGGKQETARRYFHLISSALLLKPLFDSFVILPFFTNFRLAGYIEMQVIFISILNVRCHAMTNPRNLLVEYLSAFVFVWLLVQFRKRNVLIEVDGEINFESLLMRVKDEFAIDEKSFILLKRCDTEWEEYIDINSAKFMQSKGKMKCVLVEAAVPSI